MSEEAEKPLVLPNGDGILRREYFSDEGVRRYAAEFTKGGGPPPMSEEERESSRAETLARLAPSDNVWFFGYGSLMWNPMIEVAESRTAQIVGWHRHFCLTLNLGRGTPEQPGLMLGLDSGGSCTGVVHRVEAAKRESELKILWQREMMSGAYRPCWVRAETESGALDAVTFVVRRDHPRYEGKLAEAIVAARIAVASGILGTNRDYLYRTAAHLSQLGVADDPLIPLAARVREIANEHEDGARS